MILGLPQQYYYHDDLFCHSCYYIILWYSNLLFLVSLLHCVCVCVCVCLSVCVCVCVPMFSLVSAIYCSVALVCLLFLYNWNVICSFYCVYHIYVCVCACVCVWSNTQTHPLQVVFLQMPIKKLLLDFIYWCGNCLFFHLYTDCILLISGYLIPRIDGTVFPINPVLMWPCPQ